MQLVTVSYCKYGMLYGAGRGNRTPKGRSPADFESAASASSAIPAANRINRLAYGRQGSRSFHVHARVAVAEFSDLVGFEISLGRRIVLQIGIPEGHGLELRVLEEHAFVS
jgi:hypothetical protein